MTSAWVHDCKRRFDCVSVLRWALTKIKIKAAALATTTRRTTTGDNNIDDIEESSSSESRRIIISSCFYNEIEDDDLFSKLPEDVLISDILKKLPTVDLLRLVLVSKRFKYFISHHIITTTFLQSSPSSSYLLFHTDGHRNRFYLCHNNNNNNNNNNNDSTASFFSYKSVELPCHHQTFSTGGDAIKLMSSAGGVICFLLHSAAAVLESPGTLFLWNPLIGVLKPLPPTPESWNPRRPIRIAYGFVFDPSTVDFKVVKIVYWGCNACNIFQAQAFVYTQRTKSWRTIGNNIDVPCIAGPLDFHCCSRVSVKGVVYWHGYKNLHPEYIVDSPDCIMGFDLVKEVFKVIELQRDIMIVDQPRRWILPFRLSTWHNGKSMAVFVHDVFDYNWTMFVVNDCDGSSKTRTILPWEKKFTTRVVDAFAGYDYFILNPERLVNDREFIAETIGGIGMDGEHFTKIVVIDVETDEIKDLPDYCHMPPFTSMIDYTPSLALLNYS